MAVHIADSARIAQLQELAPALEAFDVGEQWLPPSQQVAAGKDSLVLAEPAGYVYLGILEERGSAALVTLRRVLICDGAPGRCQPTVAGNTMGCLSDSASAERSSSSCGLTFRSTPEPVKGGYIRGDFGVQPASKADTLPSAFPEMLGIAALNDKVGAYLGSRYAGSGKMPAWVVTDSGYAAPDGYKGLILSVAGRALAVLVPKAKANAQREVVGTEVRALHTAQQVEKGMLFFPSQTGSWSIRNGEEVHRYRTYVR